VRNLKISTKMLVGFGIVVAVILAISLVSIINIKGLDSTYSNVIVTESMPLNPAINAYGAIQAMRSDSRNFVLYTGNKEKVLETRTSLDAWAKEFEDSSANFGKNVNRADAKKTLEDAMKLYYDTFKPGLYKLADDAEKGVPQADMLAYIETVTRPAGVNVAEAFLLTTDLKMETLVQASDDSTAKADGIVLLMEILLVAGIVIAVFFGVYISGQISKPLAVTVKMINEMARGHLNMRLRLDRRDEIGVMAKTMDSFADDMQNIVIGTMKKISVGDLSAKIDTNDSSDEISAALKGTIESLQSLINEDGGRVLQATAGKDLTQRLTGEYTGDYAKMKDNINTVVDTIDQANSQILASAQNLAEGSNEQASSLEEVSASLEEIASMTKQNADNSNQAKILAGEARNAANEGDASMKKMAAAIQEIKQSADNTARIIKSIDDIAFQTNLLALNAAVEAARAGEAGKGFAVVAEEVRNLAMRSADAAKNTADMIEESVKNADGGVKITEEVAKSLNQIVDRIVKVGDLITEVASASSEQSQGVEQVNVAVAQMSQVTQNFSKEAEELASMAREFKLSESGSRTRQSTGVRHNMLPPKQHRRPAAALPDKSKPAKAVKAEDIIPLDDDELHDF
jgi:methyl-accepting chemotaxis protein